MSELFSGGITLAVISIFITIHLFAKELHGHLFKSTRVAISFSGGLAIAYVFLHLLPELEKGETTLGQFPAHLLSLLGFLIFYGTQRLAWHSAQQWALQYQNVLFGLQMTFACTYNFLLIYTIPESLSQNLLWAILYATALGLHLLANSHSHHEKHGHLFQRYGRFMLVGSLVFGGVIKLGLGSENELFANALMALLAGFLMFNIFAKELPDQQDTHYGWFVFGAVLYVGLISSSMYLIGGESESHAIVHWLYHA